MKTTGRLLVCQENHGRRVWRTSVETLARDHAWQGSYEKCHVFQVDCHERTFTQSIQLEPIPTTQSFLNLAPRKKI